MRGHDLLPSSGAQLLLAAAMGTESLAGVRFVHHDLVTDVRGHKLSKRDDADAHAVAATPTAATASTDWP
ncbi:MAG: hypothetical protein U0R64_04635 [Candidatus Nanopelagicales bacterium]